VLVLSRETLEGAKAPYSGGWVEELRLEEQNRSLRVRVR